MKTVLLNWIRKKLGYHVCEEFTRWESFVARGERYSLPGDPNYTTTGTYTYIKHFQRRYCTICGKVFQRELEYPDS